MVGAYLTIFTSTALSSYVMFILIFFLQDEPFSLRAEESLYVAGKLLFLSYPFCIVASFGSGWIYGKFGKRRPIFVGFILSVLALGFAPFLSNKVMPGLYICLVIIQLGSTITSSAPLIVDCVKEDSLSAAIAIQGLV